MRQLSPSGEQAISDLAQRHGFSKEATRNMLDAIISGNGSMAQFSHPEFGGAGQWMRGGMIMISDMFNNNLKARIDALCSDLSDLVARGPSGNLFVPPPAGSSGEWWPAGIGWPNSTGSQNNVRYAYFQQARRLAIEVDGTVTVYDTLDHQIGGFAQQQSDGNSITVSSQHGIVNIADLPVVSINDAPQSSPPPPRSSSQASK